MGAWSRRSVLAAAATLGALPAWAAAAPRVATLDWTLATTLLSLGAVPVGIAEQRLYRDWVGTPALPDGVVELGLRTTPSFETLVALKPDLIGINALNAPGRDRLERIAPTVMNTIFSAERAPLAGGRALARRLGALVGEPARAEALIRDTDDRLGAIRARLAGRQARPLLPLSLADARHVTVYGQGSLYADVLAALGLRSAFAGATGLWGSVIRGIEVLAEVPPADLLVIAPVPPAARRMMAGEALWSSLVAARGHRVYALPPVWAFGDLSAAVRFADVLAVALDAGPAAPDRKA